MPLFWFFEARKVNIIFVYLHVFAFGPGLVYFMKEKEFINDFETCIFLSLFALVIGISESSHLFVTLIEDGNNLQVILSIA